MATFPFSPQSRSIIPQGQSYGIQPPSLSQNTNLPFSHTNTYNIANNPLKNLGANNLNNAQFQQQQAGNAFGFNNMQGGQSFGQQQFGNTGGFMNAGANTGNFGGVGPSFNSPGGSFPSQNNSFSQPFQQPQQNMTNPALNSNPTISTVSTLKGYNGKIKNLTLKSKNTKIDDKHLVKCIALLP
jgi:hypothetical protein